MLIFNFTFSFHFSISHSSVIHREICVKDFSGTTAPRVLKFGTSVGYDLLYRVKENQHTAAYHSPYLSIFLYLQIFCYKFLSFYESQSLPILYTHCQVYCGTENKTETYFAFFFLFSSPELKAHWWTYRIGRPPSSVICPSVCPLSTLFKHLLRNHWANWSQISCEVSIGLGNECLFKRPGHMTKMAAMPIYGKNKNLLLWNQKADDLETWYATLGAQVLPSLFKWWPCVDLDLFYGKVKFGPLCFCMGKR